METKEKYEQLKKNHEERVILFRNGDFYESYENDADILAKLLGLALTQKKDVRMCAFPHASLCYYLPVVLRHGHRVAITDL